MRILLLFFLIIGVVSSSRANEVQQLQATNRLLRAELELAQKGKLYMVFDLHEQQIQFKLSGVTAARLTITDTRYWGPEPSEKVRLLQMKEEVKSAEREKIQVAPVAEVPPVVATTTAEPKAPEAAPKPFALQALEIDDMPAQYHMVLDDGIRISVRSAREEGMIAFFRDQAERLWWYLSRPLVSLWQYFQGKTYTEVVLTLPSRDAQLLYWSFNEGAPCLLRRTAPAE